MRWNNINLESDILFSDLGVGGVERAPNLMESYSRYSEVFNQIASRLEDFIIESNAADDSFLNDEIESRIGSILYDHEENDIDELYSTFQDFLSNYNQFLDGNQTLYRALNDRGFPIDDISRRALRTWRWWQYSLYPTNRGARGLQVMGCSYLIVDRLWDVYCFVTKQDKDVYELAYNGCKLIGYTWKDYFKALRYIPRAPKLFIEAVVAFTRGVPTIGKKTTTRFNHVEKVGAAFAEFPYSFLRDGTVGIMPSVISKKHATNFIKTQYKPDNMQLDLKNKHGLSVALFDHKGTSGRIICLSFAGTRVDISSATGRKVMVQNGLTDVFQYFNVPSRTYFASVAILQEVMKSFPGRRIFVFGHSLGGGLMQYSCATLNSELLHGFGYNSAGLSQNTLNTIPCHLQGNMKCHIRHICSLHDPVSRLGYLIPTIKYVKSVKGNKSHGLKQLNEEINGGHELRVVKVPTA